MAPTEAASAKRAGGSSTKKTASKDTAATAKKVKDTEKAATKKGTKKELTEADKKKLGLQREKEFVLPCNQLLSAAADNHDCSGLRND